MTGAFCDLDRCCATLVSLPRQEREGPSDPAVLHTKRHQRRHGNVNQHGEFVISPVEGELRVRKDAELDRENIAFYNLTIEAKDRGLPSLSSTTGIVYVNRPLDRERVSEYRLTITVKDNPENARNARRGLAQDVTMQRENQIGNTDMNSENSHDNCAGIFVTTVVAGGIALVRPFTAASRPFLRDAIFYMIAVFLTFVALYFEQVTLAEALSFLGLYIFYVLTVVVSTWLHKRQRRERFTPPSHPEPELSTDSEEGDSANVNGEEEYQPLLPTEETTFQILTQSINPLDYRKWRRKPCYWKLLKACKLPVELVLLLTVPIVDPDRDDQNWKRPLNCLHLVTGPLICILALKSGTYGLYKFQGVFPVWGLVVLVGATLAAVLFCVTRNDEPPRCHFLFAFLGFFVSAMWINAAATEVVNILQTLGIIFHLSNTVLGLTLLAWGNSIGDMFSDLTMARQGYPRMAFSACFGGIIFNMLVGVGLGCLLQMSSSKWIVRLEPDGLLVWILAGALGLSLVISFLSVPAQCFHLGPVYGYCLIAYYVVFLT
ncbi:PREDICTED: sodium/potassium/calcium exchanger 6, mitochondrial-like, partial [Thamnophis sirtalis]|uniref:Sodium/potassium/calcium exchanger 6, mitochondrial-like n=1 Tax=Thamnophis sirtalis TaxID=35019 RepID=A0A6I9X496_9SAUR